MLPSVSVVVRSYNRLDACCELIERVLEQDYPSFEVVVVEQTLQRTDAQRARLAELERDPRVRVLSFPPLGAARARNVGWRAAKHEIVLFMDDDDLPLRSDWIRCHAKNFADPLCIGVAGREVRAPDGAPAPMSLRRARRLCLSYSFLKMPRGYTRHGHRIEGIAALQGGNVSIRREAIQRAGGWDELTESTDENSFDFRFDRVKRPGEYRVYDPTAVMWRRLDVTGGLARRAAPVARSLKFELEYSHRVVRRYFPVRFWAFYPAYVYLALRRTYDFQWRQGSHPSRRALLASLAREIVPALRRVWSPGSAGHPVSPQAST